MTRITQYSAVNLYPEIIVGADTWNPFPTPDIVEQTIKAVEKRGVTVITAVNGDEVFSPTQK